MKRTETRELIEVSRKSREASREATRGNEKSYELSPFMISAWRAWLDQGPAVRASLRYFTEAFDDFDSFLDQLEGVSAIYFVGQGDSLFVGQAADYFVRYLDGCITASIGAYEFTLHPPPLSRTTLVVAISASGEVGATVDAAAFARGSGAPVLGLTCNAGSSLAHACDFFLTPVLNEKSAVPLNSTTSSMALLFMAVLFVLRSFRAELPPELEERYDYVEDSLNKVPSVIDRVEDSLEGTMRGASELVATSLYERGSRDIYYVGTGPGKVAATIGATKIKELCYYHSSANDLEEFAHYQKLLLNPGDPVFLVNPGGGQGKRVHDFLRGFHSLGASVFWLTSPNLFPDLERRRFPSSIRVVKMPEVLEVFQPLVFVVPMQVFALYFTTAVGENPTTFRSQKHLEFVDIYTPRDS
ncbi:MAG: SIS domain-containing protein [Promethearchaeota archaeon]